MAKYAVKVPFDDENSDMLFVTEGDSKFHLRIKTFATPEEARALAKECGPNAMVVELIDDYTLYL